MLQFILQFAKTEKVTKELKRMLTKSIIMEFEISMQASFVKECLGNLTVTLCVCKFFDM